MSFAEEGMLCDGFVNWDIRLAKEIPFLKSILAESGARKVADVACGTGMYAIALVREGFGVTGFDPEETLLAEAARRAEKTGIRAEWVIASFSTLPEKTDSRFDGVLCLGNSLSLVPPEDLDAAVANMAGLVESGGLFIAHTINFPMLALRDQEPWGPVKTLDNGALLLKGFVPREKGPWDAFFISLKPGKGNSWSREVCRFRLYPHPAEAVNEAALRAGLLSVGLYGGYSQENPKDAKSADLVYVFTNRAAKKPPRGHA